MKEFVPDSLTIDEAMDRAKESLRKYRYRENNKSKETADTRPLSK